MSENDRLVLDASLIETKKQRAPELSDSDFFELFASEQVLKDFEPSDDDIENGRVGGSNDGGLDGLYFIVNGQFITDDINIDANLVTKINLVLIQATREASFNEHRVNKLILLTDDLLNLGRTTDQLKGIYNSVLQSAIERFKEKYKAIFHVPHDFTISYYYVSKGDVATVNATLQRKKEQVIGKAHELFSKAKCSLSFVGAAQLVELIQKRPLKTYPLSLAETPISPKGQEAYICLVSLLDYYNFIVDENKQIRNQLFESNVRDWQGKVKVNEEIKQSLEDTTTGEDFWWLNNGITIIAAKASTTGGQILSIEDPQIVNGLQTSRSIFNYVSTHNVTSETRKLLVRIISQNQMESRDHIIKATNSQTEVPEQQLHATEKIQRDIENVLRQHGLFYDRRKNHYKMEGKPIAKIIEPLYLAQTIISIVLQRPNDARGRPSTVLNDSYEKVFTTKYPLELYANCSLLMKIVDVFLATPELKVERKDRINIRWYLAMDYSRAIIGKSIPDVNDLSKMIIPTKDDLLKVCFMRVCGLYDKLGGTDTVAKGPDFIGKLKAM